MDREGLEAGGELKGEVGLWRVGSYDAGGK